MKLKEDPSTGSNNDITFLKEGEAPENVIDEGDSLCLNFQIHSFYWSSDITQKEDYEPIAYSRTEQCYLSRLHYKGIVLWQDFIETQGKGTASFMRGFHTPIMCTKCKAFWLQPDDAIGNMVLYGYFLPAILKRSITNTNYEIIGYSDKMIKDYVPTSSKFTWNDISYYVIISHRSKIDDLKVSDTLKNKLWSLHRT
jgi:hypothetical protein